MEIMQMYEVVIVTGHSQRFHYNIPCGRCGKMVRKISVPNHKVYCNQKCKSGEWGSDESDSYWEGLNELYNGNGHE